MLTPIRKCLVAIALVEAFFATTGPSASAAAELNAGHDASEATIRDGDRVVLHYRFDKVPMKPFVDQLFTPDGVQVLRDSPEHHRHHHGLMFALAVDGVNFWEEDLPASGREASQSPPTSGVEIGRRVDSGYFSNRLLWVGPESDKPLLIERRKIDVLKSRGASLGATLVTWRSQLELPPGKESAAISGSHYFGLGMRFVESMDRGGRFFNADDKPGEVFRGAERLTRTKWCAYTAKADGKPVTVAIFDHPKNLRPATMFTMTKPFAYLSATMNVWKEPITLKAGQRLDLRYGVALWDGEVDAPTIEKLYQRWLRNDEARMTKDE
ncbi:MAG: DUF6807 family protein [Thermoguttaceae bacterium]